MRVLRGLIVLAVVAALWGAPQSVSAAANELTSPRVSPSSGGLTTTFTFRVHYQGGFRATSVSVAVANLTVALSLESGSRTEGWWRGASPLPPGAWSTVFQASVVQGPAPTLAGPTVLVASAAPSPTSGTAPGSSSGPTPATAPVDGVDESAAPPAAPAPSPEAVAATNAAMASPAPAAPDPDPAPESSGEGTTSGGGVQAPAPGGASGSTAGGAGAGTSGGSDDEPPSGDGAAASPTSPAPAGGVDPALVQPASETDQAPDNVARTHELVSDLLLFGLAGVASVAIIGTLLLVAGGRRKTEAATPVTLPSAADDALLRRVARSGRAQAADDPIVAALGVDDKMAARRAIRRAGRRIDDDVRKGKRPTGR